MKSIKSESTSILYSMRNSVYNSVYNYTSIPKWNYVSTLINGSVSSSIRISVWANVNPYGNKLSKI